MQGIEFLWLGLLVLAVIVEALTSSLVAIWFVGGALAAVIAALLGAELWLQITLFFVVSVALLAALRPISKRFVYTRKEPTNADRLIGRTVVVDEAIDPRTGSGSVIIDGIRWSARSDDSASIEPGADVEVLRIEGVKVVVRPTALTTGKPIQ